MSYYSRDTHHRLPQPTSLVQRVATVSFCIDALFQTLTLLSEAESSRSSPSGMYVAYAPHFAAPLLLFSGGLVVQVLWMLKLFPSGVFSGWDDEEPKEDVVFCADEEEEMKGVDNPEGKRDSEDTVTVGRQSLESTSSTVKIESTPTSQAEGFIEWKESNEEEGRMEASVAILPEPAQMRYLSHYFAGSLLHTAWSIAWMTRHYNICTPLLLVDLSLHIYVFFGLFGGSKNHRFPTSNVLTHLLVKQRIALAVMWLWKTWGAVDVIPPPSAIEAAINCLFLLVLSLSSGPDPTLGLLLSLVLFSLALGEHHDLGWHLAFSWSGVIVFVGVALDWAFGVAVRKLFCGIGLANGVVEEEPDRDELDV